MFTGHDKTNFLKLVFSNREAFDNYRRKIQTGGNEQQFPQRETQFTLYEANIDPMLRMIHLRDLSPSGWIRLRGGTYTVNSMATATTQLDLTCKWTDVTQLKREDLPPMITMAFDIEADSSHGDFHVGVKDYQKLGRELVTEFITSSLNCPRFREQGRQYLLEYLKLAFRNEFNGNQISYIVTLDRKSV